MIVGCLAGLLRRRPRLRLWAEFAGGAILVFCALLLISPLRHHAQRPEVRQLIVAYRNADAPAQ
jgi:hypothetical protein